MRAALLALLPLLAAWTVRGPEDRPTTRALDPSEVLAEAEVDLADHVVRTDPAALAEVAASTLAWLEAQEARGEAVPIGMLPEVGVSAEDLRRTLQLVAEVAAEDRGAAHQRLADPDWLTAHFRVLRWTGDAADAARHGVRLADGRIRLTSYLVDQVQGCAQRTEACDTPLYGVPVDEAHLSRAEGDAILPTLIRARYTRQQVLDGVFEPGGEAAGQAAPLVWLARPHVHEALMQGTIEVTLPDGSRRTFNVDRVNGRPYRRGVPSEEQERFWYFREVDGARGWGAEPDTRIRLRPYAAVAGDAYNLGLGSLFALRGDDGSVRLAVLADTGGAFQPNLYQLDLFTGAHPSREAFEAATADLPRRPHAYLLVAR